MTTANSTITSDYNQLISFSGYSPGQSYDAQFWQATHDSGNTLYQDLVWRPGIDFHSGAVPEPRALSWALAGW